MLPVEIVPVQETLVLRARGSELLILPHHVKHLKTCEKPKDFSEYFRGEALVNRPARKLFEAWLRKDDSLWKRLYICIHKEMELKADGEGEDEAKPAKGAKAKSAEKVPEKSAKKDEEKPAKTAKSEDKAEVKAKAPAKAEEKPAKEKKATKAEVKEEPKKAKAKAKDEDEKPAAKKKAKTDDKPEKKAAKKVAKSKDDDKPATKKKTKSDAGTAKKKKG